MISFAFSALMSPPLYASGGDSRKARPFSTSVAGNPFVSGRQQYSAAVLRRATKRRLAVGPHDVAVVLQRHLFLILLLNLAGCV